MSGTRIAVYEKPAELMENNPKERMKSSNQRVEVLSIGKLHCWIRPIGSGICGFKTFTKYLTFEK